MKKSLLFLIPIILMFASCGDPLTGFGVFEAYNGRNLIQDSSYDLSFANPNWSLVSVDTNRVNYNNAGGATGAISANAVRLEALNQLRDGDFGSGNLNNSGASSPWLFGGSMTPAFSVGSLAFEQTSSDQFAYLDLVTNRLISLAASEVITYRVKTTFAFSNPPSGKNDGIVSLFVTDGVPTGPYSDTDLANRAKASFPIGSSQTYELNIVVDGIATPDHLVVVTELGTLATLDSIEMVEIPSIGEQAYAIVLPLPIVPLPGQESLPLQSGGTFTVSMYIQEDSSLTANSNRFEVTRLGVELVAYEKGSSTPYHTASGFASVDPGPTWQQVSIEIANPLDQEALENFNFTDTETALEIRVYPFALGSPETGTIFLSDPSLTWSPF